MIPLIAMLTSPKIMADIVLVSILSYKLSVKISKKTVNKLLQCRQSPFISIALKYCHTVILFILA